METSIRKLNSFAYPISRYYNLFSTYFLIFVHFGLQVPRQRTELQPLGPPLLAVLNPPLSE